MTVKVLFCEDKGETMFYINLFLSIFCAVTTFILVSHYMYLYCLQKSSQIKEMNLITKWLFSTASFVYIICWIFIIIAFIGCYIKASSLARISFALFTVFWMIGSGILIGSMLFRIYKTFENTSYSISKTFYLVLCGTWLCGTFFLFAGYIVLFSSHYTSNRFWYKFSIIIVILSVFPILFVWASVSYLFINRLFRLSQQNKQEFKQNKDKNEMIELATKHVLLNCLTICVAFIGIVMLLVVQTSGVSFMVLIMIIYGICNFVTMYLHTNFTRNIYNKLCRSCDKLCYGLFLKLNKWSIDERKLEIVVAKA
eukprot:491579_1